MIGVWPYLIKQLKIIYNLNLNIILTDMLKTILTAVAVSAVTITSQDAATVTVSERLLDDAAIGDFTNVIAAYKEHMLAEVEDKSVAAETSVLARYKGKGEKDVSELAYLVSKKRTDPPKR